MQSPTWIALFQRIPVEQRGNLLVITANKDEIAVQEITRLEAEFMTIRGRLTGVAEVGGGFYFVPYDQIVYVGFQRPVKEADIRKMYDVGEDGLAAFPAPVAPATPEPVGAVPAGELPPLTPEPEAPKSGERPVGSAKAALLERLRARRSGNDPNKPPSK
jgi:hypothetical protein